MNRISERDFVDAAQELECEVAAIQAVAEVESAGDAFLSNGEPKILFEAHHFSRLTNHKYDVTHPRISSPTWKKSLYIGGEGEHRRLQAAAHLDRQAALEATSWGMFQIMGFNWRQTRATSLQDFINTIYSGERGQLRLFVGFIKGDNRLLRAIQKKNWILFAKYYNGAGYSANKYDVKLEQAYKRALH